MFLNLCQINNNKHEPMITTNEFDKIQKLIEQNEKPRTKTYEFVYTSRMLV